jgi:hypothetical protein
MPLPNMMPTFSPLICADHRHSDRSARLLGHRLQLRPIGTDVRDLVGDAQMNYPPAYAEVFDCRSGERV